MFLTKDEWKIYKRRNIKRLVDYYFIKISNLNKNLYEFLTKHPKYFKGGSINEQA